MLDADLRNQAMAYFPEILGNGTDKYDRLTDWLSICHEITSPALDEVFPETGKVSLYVDGKEFADLPVIFKYLQEGLDSILEELEVLPPAEAQYCWGVDAMPDDGEKVAVWKELVGSYVSAREDGGAEFIGALLK